LLRNDDIAIGQHEKPPGMFELGKQRRPKSLGHLRRLVLERECQRAITYGGGRLWFWQLVGADPELLADFLICGGRLGASGLVGLGGSGALRKDGVRMGYEAQ